MQIMKENQQVGGAIWVRVDLINNHGELYIYTYICQDRNINNCFSNYFVICMRIPLIVH